MNFHNRGVKLDVALFIRFLNVIVYEDYTHTHTYIYIKLNEMSKNGFLKFYNFISYVISIIT